MFVKIKLWRKLRNCYYPDDDTIIPNIKTIDDGIRILLKI